MLCGSTNILNTITEHLGGIRVGDTTKDGKFTVIEVECQGACSNAPMMAVNDDFYVSFLYQVWSVGALQLTCTAIERSLGGSYSRVYQEGA